MELDKIGVVDGMVHGVAVGMAVASFIPPAVGVHAELLILAAGAAVTYLARVLFNKPHRRQAQRRNRRRHRARSVKLVNQPTHNAKRGAPGA